ncbi:exo-alpha-sialidase [Vibrio aestuarianus]|uniref:exo-alpha-sialidase n=1 Tax=Vibrio aestuarianus TaxID=28171 RepID=UPI00237D2BBA|nr:exo-alpha-sialidase [Vibrio aestuarianus]MDE1221537.1 exo-alpha-sialidase [Vibrio aestuarianus]MDE1224702.1 exo-alpha-sialidase [Vibrio aestuarianus]MDE1340656.1 exo-alpha-sialidase [Vibrio aestuarianus]
MNKTEHCSKGITLLASVAIASSLLVSFQANAVAPNIRDTIVFKGGEGGSSHYRIPSMVVAADGSLVAFAEGRGTSGDPGNGAPTSIKSRRSTDNGQTWSAYQAIHENSAEAFSDPRPVVDASTGRIFVFYTKWDINCAQNGSCVPFDDPNHKLLYKTSDDNGQTWSSETDVLDQVRDVNWFANGDSTRNGRATWSYTPSANEVTQAAASGWQLAWNSRVANGSCNVQYYGDGNSRYLVDLVVNDDKSVKAVLYGNGSNNEYPLNFDIGGYHYYQIVGSGSNASFYVDGTLIASGWSGQSHSSQTVTWGNGCSTTPGSSAYKSIDFSIGNTAVAKFDASLMRRVNDVVINHPAEQGWAKTGANGGRGDPGWKSVNAGPGQGIQLASGRLIFPAIVLDAFEQLSVVSIYSDDHGVSWQAGQQTPTYAQEPSEADMVQLNDGRILLSARNDGVTGTGNFNRYHYISEDNGISWTVIDETRNSVNGALFFKLDQVDIGLVRYGNDRVLMSGPQGDGAVSSDRNDLAIWSATDNGSGVYNFTQRTQFRDGYSAYSDIVILPNKGAAGNEDLGVIYEAKSSTEIRVMVMDINSVN